MEGAEEAPMRHCEESLVSGSVDGVEWGVSWATESKNNWKRRARSCAAWLPAEAAGNSDAIASKQSARVSDVLMVGAAKFMNSLLLTSSIFTERLCGSWEIFAKSNTSLRRFVLVSLRASAGGRLAIENNLATQPRRVRRLIRGPLLRALFLRHICRQQSNQGRKYSKQTINLTKTRNYSENKTMNESIVTIGVMLEKKHREK